jgi:hypothetical protein
MKKVINWLGYGMLLLGLLSISIAFLADQVNLGGQSGFGGKQKISVFVGGLLVFFGILFALPAGRRFLNAWIYPASQERAGLPTANRKEILRTSLLVSAWFGLMVGLLEVGYQLYKHYILSKPFNLTEHFIWMTPLAYLTMFTGLGLLIGLVWLALPRLFTIRSVTFILIFLACLTLYYNSPKFHILAMAVLAAGISLQLSGFYARRAGLFYRSVLLTLPWMFTVVLAAMAFMITYFG